MSDKLKPYFMWSLPLLFFAFQFILRLWPGLNMQKYLEQFTISASDFGLFAAFYYYGYAAMQIPLAILLEKYPVNRINALCAGLCGIAMLVLVQTHSFYLALLCRFMIGVGSAVGFLATSKVLMLWFKSDRYAQLVGLSFTFGLIGAIYGGKPVALLIEQFGSHNTGFALALIALAIALLLASCLSNPSKNTAAKQQQLELSMIKELLKSRSLWLLALANLLMVGALEGFADVWGVPYLMQAYQLSQADSALLCSFIFMGMLFGGPLLATISKYSSYHFVLISCGFGLALSFLLLLSNQVSSYTALASLFFTIGLLCCYQVIVFATGQTLVAKHLLGICIAFLNSINMLGGSFFHTLIGRAMDIFWDGKLASNGLKLYSLANYRYALSIIPICAILGVICLFGQQKYSTKLTLEPMG